MTTVIYDGSYDGLLTAIFEIYEYKIAQPDIKKESDANISLFASAHTVITSIKKSERVLKKLRQKLSPPALKNLFAVFLSESPGLENNIYLFVKEALISEGKIDENYVNDAVLYIKQLSRKVYKERHRMEAFIRFKLTADGIYYATIEPDYNIIPLLIQHFEKRYADQPWLIYDMHRRYGVYYNLKITEMIYFDFKEFKQKTQSTGVMEDIHTPTEEFYQKLWKNYFNSINIQARKNKKLHLQHVPKRYWKYLIEKT